MIGRDKKTFWKTTCSCIDQPTTDFDPILGTAIESLESINDLFDYFIDDFIIDKIVACTNKRLIEEQKPVNSVEIKGFIGLMLLLGATKKHDVEISDVYKFGSVHHTDWATVCMSRERFHLISAKITFDDIATRTMRYQSNPKLHKICEIFEHLTKKFQAGLVFSFLFTYL
jgi:hypothetical protein